MSEAVEKVFDLSVVVTLVSDTTNHILDLSLLRDCLDSLQKQDEPPSMEVIVPYMEGSADFSPLAAEFPETDFLCVHGTHLYSRTEKGREHHHELRAQGILAAKGRIVALVEDCARVDEKWSKNIILAHRQDFAGIGGAIENQVDRALNWAVYFCDFGKYQNPIPAGKTSFASDANISYKHASLLEIDSVWRDAYHEGRVNWYLLTKGYNLGISPDIMVFQNRKNLRLPVALQERSIWGRSYATIRLAEMNFSARLFHILISPVIPIAMYVRITLTASKRRGNFKRIIQCTPALVLLTVSWSIGELIGYVTKKT